MKKNPALEVKYIASACKRIVLKTLRSVLLALLAVIISSVQLSGQNQQSRSISGKVLDQSGVPLTGVSVAVTGTTIGTLTDSDGNFVLININDDAVLRFSFVGMQPQEITVSGKSVINLTMIQESYGIDEVVIVGYGTQKKINLTGSVSTVKSEEIVRVPTANVSEALVGKAPGLFAKQGTGVPGADYSDLSIRGYDAPLILVDGIETSWTRMDPNEIESISVLKDAAAAIYGIRAGNGVILSNYQTW